MEKRSLTLNSLLLIAFGIVALVPVLVLTVWIQKQAFTYEMDSVKDRHLLLAHNLTGALSRYAEDVRAVFLDAHSHHDPLENSTINDLLETMGIDLLAEVSGDGKWITIEFGIEDRLPAIGSLELLQSKARVKDRDIYWSGVLADMKGMPAVYLYWEHSPGVFTLSALKLDYIRKVQEAVTFGEKGHAAIVDHTGHILAHPKKSWQDEMKDISRLSPVRKMMAGETGVIEFYSPAVKADMVAGYATVPNTGWGVMIPQPVQELRDHAGRVHRVALAVAGGALFFTFFVGLWLSRNIVKPILLTVRATARLAENAPDKHVEVSSSLMARELVTLCSSFNQMADQVAAARSHLEERVEQRTSELKEEIDQRKKLEEKLRFMASHDELTGLPNRTFFLELLNRALQLATRKEMGVALCFIDVDDFKVINDRLGHHAGDVLLKEVAHRLQQTIRSVDVASRYGGDEFNLMLVDAGDRRDLAGVAEKLLRAAKEPLIVEGERISVTFSIGIVLATGETSAEELIRLADGAMYRAKYAGKDQYCIA